MEQRKEKYWTCLSMTLVCHGQMNLEPRRSMRWVHYFFKYIWWSCPLLGYSKSQSQVHQPRSQVPLLSVSTGRREPRERGYRYIWLERETVHVGERFWQRDGSYRSSDYPALVPWVNESAQHPAFHLSPESSHEWQFWIVVKALSGN